MNNDLQIRNSTAEFLIFATQNESDTIEVRFEENTLWLTQLTMAELFQCTPENILVHLRNIFQEGELTPEATAKEFLAVRQEGARMVQRSLKYYNLDAIIAVGYRVNSRRATQFRFSLVSSQPFSGTAQRIALAVLAPFMVLFPFQIRLDDAEETLRRRERLRGGRAVREAAREIRVGGRHGHDMVFRRDAGGQILQMLRPFQKIFGRRTLETSQIQHAACKTLAGHDRLTRRCTMTRLPFPLADQPVKRPVERYHFHDFLSKGE